MLDVDEPVILEFRAKGKAEQSSLANLLDGDFGKEARLRCTRIQGADYAPVLREKGSSVRRKFKRPRNL